MKKNISKTARLLGLCRKTVRKAVNRYMEWEENLQNRSPRLKHSPNKTPAHIEQAIIKASKSYHCGRGRLYRLLIKKKLGGKVMESMRYTLRRHKLSGKYR